MTSVQAAAMAAADGWDSDGSLSWEDFFGTSTDLVPTLLGMYDTLIGRSQQDMAAAATPPPKRALDMPAVARPLSVSSIASSSSSSSSGASSCSGGGGGGTGGGGRRLGAATKSSPYLASIESLDDSDEERGARQGPGSRPGTCPGAGAGAGSQGSEDSGLCSPRYLTYVDRVVMEIVDTEAVYVRDLHQVIQGYLQCWRAAEECPLSEQQLAQLFSNIEDIYAFNSAFLHELEECGLDPVLVACCFVRNNAGFSIYTQYCTNYPRTVSLLTELMRQERTVRLFRERQWCLQHALPLGSYLLKPVQRILKYHLLLQDLAKHCGGGGGGGSAHVLDALAAMTGIAHHINDMKRRHEHAVRVQEIQSLLYGWEGEDLTTFGELCAEGAFRMCGAKALRHAFLFDKMLLITKKKEEATLGYKAHIMCSNLMLIESVPGEPLSFHVIPFDNPRLQYTLQARSLLHKREWTVQLKRVILENYNAVIPSHARRLLMELGQNRTDAEILAEKAAPRRQHSAPEYLEKRKQERERRKSETGLRHRLKRTYKSDVGLSVESPAPHRRGRRASSGSRDRSHSRDGLRSASPVKIKERFGSWRRKSEPGCYPGPSPSPKLSVAPQPAPGPEPLSDAADGLEETACGEGQAGGGSACVSAPEGEGEGEAKTLEEIVGQLLMQNHEFQRILKRQQRHVSRLRSARDETTDDEDGVYESLAVDSFSHRPHRHTHSRTQRSWRRTEDAADADYVTLVCEDGGGGGGSASGHYDNLQQIWESVRRQQEEIHRLAESEGQVEVAPPPPPPPPTVDLRRTHSFSLSGRGGASASGTSVDTAGIPTLPAVWLRQQGEHLATPCKKSGSLPRSFQLTQGHGQGQGQGQAGRSQHRPFTIASDKPAEINFEDIERYIEQSGTCRLGHRFPTAGDTTEEDSLTEYTDTATATPNASLHQLHVHPEYRIYRPSVSRASLRHVLSSVTTKLAGMRVSSEGLEGEGAGAGPGDGDRDRDRERRASRLVYALARQYSKTLKQRIRNIMGEDSEADAEEPPPAPTTAPPPPPLPIYKQGSSSLGARIAHCSEYANPRLLFPGIGQPAPTHAPPPPPTPEGHLSDGSADSYYERSFEAIEALLEAEVEAATVRESTLLSDPEEVPEVPEATARKPAKVPPPVPAKPAGLRRPWPQESSSAPAPASTTTQKGWVRHVVGKLQGAPDSSPTACVSLTAPTRGLLPQPLP